MKYDRFMLGINSNFALRLKSLIMLLIGFALLWFHFAIAQESVPENAHENLSKNGLKNTQVNRPSNTTSEPEETLTLDFNNIDLHALIKTISIQTGRNFIVDPRVKAKVNFVSSEPVSGDKLYELFLSVLEVHGFAAVDVGTFTKIVPTQTGVQSPIPLVNQPSEQQGKQQREHQGAQSVQGEQTEQQTSGDELVTQVIRLQGMQATDVIAVLSPLLKQSESIHAEPTSNSLVITARKANVEKLIDLIRQMAAQ